MAYPDRYSPDILVRVDRAGNRMAHHIDEVHLPFTGLDLWNAYEVSALTDAGAPVNFIMRLLYPCESRYIVESKSLKLYLTRSICPVAELQPPKWLASCRRQWRTTSRLCSKPGSKSLRRHLAKLGGHMVTSPGCACEPPGRWGVVGCR